MFSYLWLAWALPILTGSIYAHFAEYDLVERPLPGSFNASQIHKNLKDIALVWPCSTHPTCETDMYETVIGDSWDPGLGMMWEWCALSTLFQSVKRLTMTL